MQELFEAVDLLFNIIEFCPYSDFSSLAVVNKTFNQVSSHPIFYKVPVLDCLFVNNAGRDTYSNSRRYNADFWQACREVLHLPQAKFDVHCQVEANYLDHGKKYSSVNSGNASSFSEYKLHYHQIKNRSVIPLHYCEIYVEEKIHGRNLAIGISNSLFELTQNYTGYSSDHAHIKSQSIGYSSDGKIRCNAAALSDGVTRTPFRTVAHRIGVLMSFLPGDSYVSFFLNGMFEHKWVIDDVEAFFSVDSIPENEPCFVSPCVTLHGKNEILRFVDREFVVPFDEYIAPAILKYLDHPDYKSEGTDM